VLQINGSPTDAAAGLIRDGIHEALDASATRRSPSSTRRTGRRRRRSNGPAARSPASATRSRASSAANDGTGGGAIAAFKAAGVNPVPPVTGNDATIAALQLIISGDQYNTISKPSEIVAAAAAKVAVKLLKGERRKPRPPLYNTPSRAVRAGRRDGENIKAEIFDKGIAAGRSLHRRICSEGCKELGIIQ
jgi:D-xylose transport system substrate-binding protein